MTKPRNPKRNAFCRAATIVVLVGWGVAGSALPAFARQSELGAAGASRQIAEQTARPLEEDDCRPLEQTLPQTLFAWNPRVGVLGEDEEEADDFQIEPLATDRPDFTEASSTVGRGVLQLEMGYTVESDDSAGQTTRTHAYPEMLWRWGLLAEWLELRAGWNYASAEVAGESEAGAEDLYLGCKLWLTPQVRWLPEMAVVPQMSVPTGHERWTAGEVLPGLNWLYGWDLNDRWSLAGSSQFNRAVDGQSAATYTEWAQSWTVGFAWTDRLKSYGEWFAFFPSGAETQPTEHYANGGLTLLLSDDVQWDLRAGVGLSEAATDSFIGTGLSIRWR